MGDEALRTLKADWTLPGEGSDEPRHRMMVDLGFLLMRAVLPGTAISRTKIEVSSTYEVDEMWGGSDAKHKYRMGDLGHGLEITDRTLNADDGVTPIDYSTEIEAYGLPDGWSLELHAYFIAPMRAEPQQMGVRALLPEAEARTVAGILKQETQAKAEIT